MSRRIHLALPLVFALGCGSTPPPSAAPQPSSASAAESKATPETKAETPATAAKEDNKKPSEGQGAPVKAAVVATDAPINTAISQDEVLAQVQKNAEPFNRCYTIGAGASKSYRAKVTVKATVGPTGSVNMVEILHSTAKNPKVDACVSEGFKKLTFPRPKGSGTTVFTFPMSFDGLEQVQ
jgi:outer membrane biosynthesis protein TonB